MPTLQIKAVNCGKSNCNRCPHGFYVYAYWKDNGRTRCKYIGSIGKDNKELNEKIRNMGEWKQWRELFKKHKESWGEKTFGNKKKSEGKRYEHQDRDQKEEKEKQERAEDDAIRNIEKLINTYWFRLNSRDKEKINKLLALIKDKVVHAGEKASAINAIERILKRQNI